MWQFTEAVGGLADGCQQLGVPVTGGNVSFYNQTGVAPIQPTPVIGVLGVHQDVRRRVRSGFTETGLQIVLLGETRAELGGSLWAWLRHGHLGGRPPAVDLEAERVLADVLVNAIAHGLVSAAHDLSDGGLAVALAESCLSGGTGCSVTLPADQPAGTFLFSESAGRAIVAVRAGAEEDFAATCAAAGQPATVLGRTGGTHLLVSWPHEASTVEASTVEANTVEASTVTVPLAELAQVHRRALPALFG
jgi:phosphoribosylformylglycinamidine synthase subunit PurL